MKPIHQLQRLQPRRLAGKHALHTIPRLGHIIRQMQRSCFDNRRSFIVCGRLSPRTHKDGGGCERESGGRGGGVGLVLVVTVVGFEVKGLYLEVKRHVVECSFFGLEEAAEGLEEEEDALL